MSTTMWLCVPAKYPHQYCDNGLNHTVHTHPPVNTWSSVTELIKLCTIADNKNCLRHTKSPWRWPVRSRQNMSEN